MSDNDRDLDKNNYIFVPDNKSANIISIDQIKSLYIASGLSVEDISKKTTIPVDELNKLIKKHKMPSLRNAYIREGISKIQNEQLIQANKLMDLESNFKKLRIKQLEFELENYLAYYARHGDFFKRHPTTGEILTDTNGIKLQISIPNVSKELSQLKESVTLSEGLKNILNQLESILNTRPVKNVRKDKSKKDDIIDIDTLDGIFK